MTSIRFVPSRLLFAGLLSAMACGIVSCKTDEVADISGDFAGQTASVDSGSRRTDAIRPGEILDVYVLNDDSFTGRYRVHRDGEIVVRKVGRIHVAGKSVSGAESAVKQALSRQLTDAKVVVARTVDPSIGETDASMEVYLSGKVNKPGKMRVAYDGGAAPTVHQVILQAGGFMRFAHKKKVHVLRRGSDGKLVKIPADITAIERGEIPDVQITGGDIVVVPEKAFGIGP